MCTCVVVMQSVVVFIVTVVFVFTVKGQEQYEGDACLDKRGMHGTCRLLFSCQSALHDLRTNSGRPTHCNYQGRMPVVCCVDHIMVPVHTTHKPRSTTTEYIPTEPDYKDVGVKRPDGCAPLDKRITAERTGRKAWDKCLDYQEQFVFPCITDVSLLKRKSRDNRCYHDADPLVKNGTDAMPREFPHMVQLKYESGSDDQFCGGSLISERFVLTAAHCTKTSKGAVVSHVLVGGLRQDEGEPHRVKLSHVYPQYNPAERYHDIALLELETPLVLTSTTVPACLDLGDEETSLAAVTGWGRVDYRAATAQVLQKAILSKFTKLECAGLFYEYARVLPRGFDETTQSCYGDRDYDRDSCSGDSGGPLQIKNPRIFCMYTIVGVTQGGIQCGNQGQPALYTKVAHYTTWIENIVWPNN